VNFIFEVCENSLWWKIKVIKIGMIYKIMPIVTPVLAGNEFVFFGLSLIMMLWHLSFLLSLGGLLQN